MSWRARAPAETFKAPCFPPGRSLHEAEPQDGNRSKLNRVELDGLWRGVCRIRFGSFLGATSGASSRLPGYVCRPVCFSVGASCRICVDWSVCVCWRFAAHIRQTAHAVEQLRALGKELGGRRMTDKPAGHARFHGSDPAPPLMCRSCAKVGQLRPKCGQVWHEREMGRSLPMFCRVRSKLSAVGSMFDKVGQTQPPSLAKHRPRSAEVGPCVFNVGLRSVDICQHRAKVGRCSAYVCQTSANVGRHVCQHVPSVGQLR